MGEAEDVAQEVRETHDVVRCVLIEGERSSGTWEKDSQCMWVTNILFTFATWKTLPPSGCSAN